MKEKQKRGFALMDKKKLQQISRKAGKASAASPNHNFPTTEEAARGGKKGGATTSQNREHMSRIGSIGGANRQALAAKNRRLEDAAALMTALREKKF